MIASREVAEWMMAELQKDGALYQDIAAREIEVRFGKKFTYVNENGNVSIDRGVLARFRKLTEKTAVWSSSERAWNLRQDWHDEGRRTE